MSILNMGKHFYPSFSIVNDKDNFDKLPSSGVKGLIKI